MNWQKTGLVHWAREARRDFGVLLEIVEPQKREGPCILECRVIIRATIIKHTHGDLIEKKLTERKQMCEERAAEMLDAIQHSTKRLEVFADKIQEALDVLEADA